MKPIPQVQLLKEAASTTLPSTDARRSVPSRRGISSSEERPLFRDIGRDFLRGEAHKNFCAELFLFGVIVLMSAWPLFWLVDAWTALPR